MACRTPFVRVWQPRMCVRCTPPTAPTAATAASGLLRFPMRLHQRATGWQSPPVAQLQLPLACPAAALSHVRMFTTYPSALLADPATQPGSSATSAVRPCRLPSEASQALSTPVVNAVTYRLKNTVHGAKLCDVKGPHIDETGFLYSRWANPTVQTAGKIIAELEGSQEALLFGSGMAAITSALLTELRTGDHIVAPSALYGGTHEFLSVFGARLGVDVTYIDGTSVAEYAAALRPNTKVVYLESPSNPTCRVQDLRAIVSVVEEHRKQTAHDNCKVMIDSTFATPYHCRPLNVPGIDVVIHSVTKYLSGHSDLLAGAVCSNDLDFMRRCSETLKLFGGIMSASDAYLVIRGLKTFHARMRVHNENAMALATFLESHPKIARVWYPGLRSHPDHSLASSTLTRGFGGMMAFEVAGGLEAARRVVENLQVISLAVHLGAVQSLIEHPRTMTHAMVPTEDCQRAGITDGLIRFSVGIEDVDDLKADLSQALNMA